MNHTPECLRLQAEQKAALAAWDAAWPNACPQCHGAGVQVQRGDWVPYGSTSAQLPDTIEPCRCADAFDCPRCGETVVEWFADGCGDLDTAPPCPDCGWAWGKGKDDVRPAGMEECPCFLSEEPEPDWEWVPPDGPDF